MNLYYSFSLGRACEIIADNFAFAFGDQYEVKKTCDVVTRDPLEYGDGFCTLNFQLKDDFCHACDVEPFKVTVTVSEKSSRDYRVDFKYNPGAADQRKRIEANVSATEAAFEKHANHIIKTLTEIDVEPAPTGLGCVAY